MGWLLGEKCVVQLLYLELFCAAQISKMHTTHSEVVAIKVPVRFCNAHFSCSRSTFLCMLQLILCKKKLKALFILLLQVQQIVLQGKAHVMIINLTKH